MEKYDPGKPIDTDEWLALDEADSIGLVQIFHEEHDEELPEDALTMHSSIHVVVENQLAMGV